MKPNHYTLVSLSGGCRQNKKEFRSAGRNRIGFGACNRLIVFLAMIGLATGSWAAKPATPTNLVATATNSTIVLTWTDNASDETAYMVERSVANAYAFGLLSNIAANSVTVTDAGVLTNVTYYYRVRCYNGNNATTSDRYSLYSPIAWAIGGSTQQGSTNVVVYQTNAIIQVYGPYASNTAVNTLTFSGGVSNWSSGNQMFISVIGNVTATITNGLASTNWVLGLGYVTASITNGYATTNWVLSQNYTTATVTNGLASTNWVIGLGYATTNYVLATSNSIMSEILGSNYVNITQVTNLTGTLYVPLTRTLSVGFGLIGGGDLSDDRSFQVDTSVLLTTSNAWYITSATNTAAGKGVYLTASNASEVAVLPTTNWIYDIVLATTNAAVGTGHASTNGQVITFYRGTNDQTGGASSGGGLPLWVPWGAPESDTSSSTNIAGFAKGYLSTATHILDSLGGFTYATNTMQVVDICWTVHCPYTNAVGLQESNTFQVGWYADLTNILNAKIDWQITAWQRPDYFSAPTNTAYLVYTNMPSMTAAAALTPEQFTVHRSALFDTNLFYDYRIRARVSVLSTNYNVTPSGVYFLLNDGRTGWR